MTDIVYILGNGAAEINDRPLRWSLRSLEKFASNVGRVVVAGRIPRWLSDEVVKVPTPETTARGANDGKAWNIMYGLKAAVEGTGLDRPFLFSSDDHYLAAPADLDQWPRYVRVSWSGLLLPTEALCRRKLKKAPDLYIRCLAETRSLMERHNLVPRNCSIHLDTWIDPVDLAEAVRVAESEGDKATIGYETHCLVAGLHERRVLAGGGRVMFTPYLHDAKAKSADDCQAKVDDGRPAFSTTPDAELDCEVAAWMEAFYDKPSRWETDREAWE